MYSWQGSNGGQSLATWFGQTYIQERTCNSMNNLLSYCGLVDTKIKASDKDLPVK